MHDLKRKKIQDLVHVHNSKRIPLSSQQRENLKKVYPYYGAQGIVDYVDNYIFDGEYILVAEDGENLRSNNQDICNLVTGKFWVNNHAHILSGNEENITKYLFYNFNRIHFEPYITGSAQPKLNKENLLNIETYVHNRKDQQKIAAVLSALDDKIELNNKINAELEAMAKTLYDYWFVQFDFPDENGKPYKSSGGKMVYNQKLKREIPEGWEMKSLLDIATFTNGLACQKFRPVNDKDLLPVIKIKEMNEGISANTELVRSDIPEKVRVHNGDVLFSWSASLDVKIWTGGKGGLNQHIFKVTSTKYPRTFYYYEVLSYLQHFKMMAELRKTTMGHITQDHLKQSRISVPPINLIKQLHQKINPLIELTIKNKEQNLELANLRDWLLPLLMNGQVSVGEAYEQTEEALSVAAEGITTYLAAKNHPTLNGENPVGSS